MDDRLMKGRVPISAAKDIAKKYTQGRVVILSCDDVSVSVVTYGRTLEECALAAEDGNRLKRLLGWPEDLCNEVPARISRKKGKKDA